MIEKAVFLGLIPFASVSLYAALEPLSPVLDARVPCVPAVQKEIMSLATLRERMDLLKEDRDGAGRLANDKSWRRARPLILEFRATAGEDEPWSVTIGKKPDLSDGRTWCLATAKLDATTGRLVAGSKTQDVFRVEVPQSNLEIASRYYWRVASRGRCGAWGCGPLHGCEACQRVSESPIASFRTEDFAPRWIELEGRVGNVRDLGGRIGIGGKRIRQGLVYRGEGLNDNSLNGERKGRNRLMVEDVDYLVGTLNIKTDLDLRGIGETADLTESPLGKGVKLILNSSESYKGVFTRSGMAVMASNFRVFCDRKNYPIYFHCIGGADRTGALAYVLCGVLGVGRQELETDWESTFYPKIPDEHENPDYWRRESHFNVGFSKYGDESTSWNDRIVLYLKDCGVLDEEIHRFREIMLQ